MKRLSDVIVFMPDNPLKKRRVSIGHGLKTTYAVMLIHHKHLPSDAMPYLMYEIFTCGGWRSNAKQMAALHEYLQLGLKVCHVQMVDSGFADGRTLFCRARYPRFAAAKKAGLHVKTILNPKSI
jgi:hypothetical protein